MIAVPTCLPRPAGRLVEFNKDRLTDIIVKATAARLRVISNYISTERDYREDVFEISVSKPFTVKADFREKHERKS